MFTATLCLLQDQVESADDAIAALESDISDLDHADPAIAAVRNVQREYQKLIALQRAAISELRKLTHDTRDPSQLISNTAAGDRG